MHADVEMHVKEGVAFVCACERKDARRGRSESVCVCESPPLQPVQNERLFNCIDTPFKPTHSHNHSPYTHSLSLTRYARVHKNDKIERSIYVLAALAAIGAEVVSVPSREIHSVSAHAHTQHTYTHTHHTCTHMHTHTDTHTHTHTYTHSTAPTHPHTHTHTHTHTTTTTTTTTHNHLSPLAHSFTRRWMTTSV
jgi:hypothetical protein